MKTTEMSRARLCLATSWIAGLYVLTALAGPVVAQQPRLKIAYEEPRAAQFWPIYERLSQMEVLEELQAFMGPLRLPRDITVRLAQCGGPNLPYKPLTPVTVCYELIDQIEQFAAAHTQNANLAQVVIVGGVVQAVLHETAHALFDVFDTPIWGRAEDAADDLAALIMTQFGDDVANVVMRGTLLLFQWSDQKWTGNAFASEMSPDYQRYFNYACIAVAANRPLFESLKKYVIPERRRNRCNGEYLQIRKAFDLRIMPHINPDELVKVKASRWLAFARNSDHR